MSAITRKQLLVLGGGFSGLYTAPGLEKALARESDVRITLVNRENFSYQSDCKSLLEEQVLRLQSLVAHLLERNEQLRQLSLRNARKVRHVAEQSAPRGMDSEGTNTRRMNNGNFNKHACTGNEDGWNRRDHINHHSSWASSTSLRIGARHRLDRPYEVHGI
jgi:hypothetical protein